MFQCGDSFFKDLFKAGTRVEISSYAASVKDSKLDCQSSFAVA